MAFRILTCYSKQGGGAVKPSHTPHPPPFAFRAHKGLKVDP